MASTQTPSPYGYTPSVGMSVVGTVWFWITTVYLLFQYMRTRCWFLIAVIMGALSKCTEAFTGLITAESLASGSGWTYRSFDFRLRLNERDHVPYSISSDHVRAWPSPPTHPIDLTMRT
jgi:hypothetical protein